MLHTLTLSHTKAQLPPQLHHTVAQRLAEEGADVRGQPGVRVGGGRRRLGRRRRTVREELDVALPVPHHAAVVEHELQLANDLAIDAGVAKFAVLASTIDADNDGTISA